MIVLMSILKTVKTLYIAGAVYICMVCIVSAEDTVSLQEKLDGLTAKLAEVNQSLESVQKQMMTKHREMARFEHEIVYTNGVPAEIYKEVKELERQLVEKRKELQEATMKVPGVRERHAERKELFGQESALKDRKLLLENEINSIRYQMMSADAKKNLNN